MRQAERALFDLRRGVPVLLADLGSDTLVLPVEALTDNALADAQLLTGSLPQLVLTRHRMAALGHLISDEAQALTPSGLTDSAQVRRLASARDARLPDSLRRAPASAGAAAALRLLGRAQLLPAAVVFPVLPTRAALVAGEIASGNLLSVSTADVLALCDGGHGVLTRISEARIPLADADKARFVLFREADGLREHVAIVIGDPDEWAEPVPVRLHSSCLTGDLFGSLRCDCGEQLRRGVAAINAQGGGVLLYLSQEGRGIGLANKLRAYALQDDGLDTIDADQVIGFGDDERDFRIARQILDQLGVSRVLLLTNNPGKIDALRHAGINVVARQAIYGDLTSQNQRYLETKARRQGHNLGELLGMRPLADGAGRA
ncbi:GTP cyclohydrolase II [Methyloversatilis sp.]|uniref:GTP cyclohydrolase II n=1 Tax=Methyloversatilis sp. TaxID=2569862 RepID=UPI002735FEDF|nr:GTP cyclohydrolase II [Methyloversatilis sp.]MDP3454659.1 GTP cyclohydrolase II [Methyloversatilis sp.]MDP3577259.1 GTP cyclohydrolase II [Methyloversatilis sp.]